MGDTLRISRAVVDAILREAAGSRVEICGLLLGASGLGEDVVAHCPAANIALDPARAFEIEPGVLIGAYRTARRGGPMVIGHYHSHPTGDPKPSFRDAEKAPPDGRIWLIAGDGEIAAWRAVRDGAVHGRFDRVVLVVTDACA